MPLWNAPHNVDRQSCLILLQHQYTWPFRIVWILFDKHCINNPTKYLSRSQIILSQLIVSMLRYSSFSNAYQHAHFLN